MAAMEYRSRVRRTGAQIVVGAGVVATLAWLLADDDAHLGPITTFFVLEFAVAAIASLTPARRIAWWAARIGGVLLALDFLGAVADRFGAFGAPGADGVSWGSWGEFVDYTASLVPWWPWPQLPAVGATTMEVVLGILLLTGHWWRWVGKVAGALLFVYLVTMVVELGWDEMMSYDLPVLIGGALLVSERASRRQQPRTGPVPMPDAEPTAVPLRTVL